MSVFNDVHVLTFERRNSLHIGRPSIEGNQNQNQETVGTYRFGFRIRSIISMDMKVGRRTFSVGNEKGARDA